jgi:hypothetical protein
MENARELYIDKDGEFVTIGDKLKDDENYIWDVMKEGKILVLKCQELNKIIPMKENVRSLTLVEFWLEPKEELLEDFAVLLEDRELNYEAYDDRFMMFVDRESYNEAKKILKELEDE